jgi:hypothetical protein
MSDGIGTAGAKDDRSGCDISKDPLAQDRSQYVIFDISNSI